MKRHGILVSFLCFGLSTVLWYCAPLSVCDTAGDCQSRGFSTCQQGRCVGDVPGEGQTPKEPIGDERTDAGQPDQAKPPETPKEPDSTPERAPEVVPEPAKPKACIPTKDAGTLGELKPFISKGTFSQNGKLFATNPGKEAHIWDVETSKVIFKLKGHTSQVLGIAFSPDGTMLATGSEDKSVKLWSATSGKLLRTFTQLPHADAVYDVAFSPDGSRLVSASYDGTVRQWDPTLGNFVFSSRLTGRAFTSVAYSADGSKIIASSWGGAVYVWNSNMKRLHAYNTGLSIYRLALSPDQKTLSIATAEKDARLLDIATGREIRRLTGHKNVVFASQFTKDGLHLLTASADRTIKQWEVSTGKLVRTYKGHIRDVNSLSLHPTKPWFASTGLDKTIRLWDHGTGKMVKQLENVAWWNRIAFSPDGKWLATASADATVTLWSWPERKAVMVLKGHSDQVSGLAFRSDSQVIATSSHDQSARVWDVKTGMQLHKMDHGYTLYDIAFHPNGKQVATVGQSRQIMFWDPSNGQTLFQLDSPNAVPNQALYDVEFTPDGASVVVAGNGKVVSIWDVATRKQKKQLTGHQTPARELAIQASGLLIASAGERRTIKLWEVTNGTSYGDLTLTTSQWGIYQLAFRPDGKMLAAGYRDGSIRLWDTNTKKLVHTLKSHTARAHGSAFHPFDGSFVSASIDNTIRIWQCP